MKIKSPVILVIIIAVGSFFFASCTKTAENNLLIFTNATIWDGTGELHQNATLLTEDGKVTGIIPMNDPSFPESAEHVDLNGRFVIPGLINAHGHVGVAKGLQTGGPAESVMNVSNQLKKYARYGITTVVSLGDEPVHAFLVRDNNDPAAVPMARLYLAGEVLNPPNPEEAREAVNRRSEMNPDWLKIRIDDGLGSREKMSREVYSAIFDQADSQNIPVAAHIVELYDAIAAVREGASLVGHSVRDQPVTDELIEVMKENSVCVTPTLTRELSTFIYRERPEFFDDPFFTKEVDPQVIEQLQLPRVQEYYSSEEADYYRDALPLATENMMALHNAGVKVAMGTDSGPPARFQGYFEHMEMEMMQDAGMSPEEVLLSATRIAAECTFLDDELGTLEVGKWADFVVLDENPLSDVRNLRTIESVFVGGNRVDLRSPYHSADVQK
jgi:imidazolonepropionase-like amidohydrolase